MPGSLTAFSLHSPLFRIFIARTVISRAARKLSHASCTSNDVNIVNRHQMQTQLQTQEGWWGHVVHTSDQVQENLRDPDAPFENLKHRNVRWILVLASEPKAPTTQRYDTTHTCTLFTVPLTPIICITARLQKQKQRQRNQTLARLRARNIFPGILRIFTKWLEILTLRAFERTFH